MANPTTVNPQERFRFCTNCGKPRSQSYPKPGLCRSCFLALNKKTSNVCTACGGPRQRKSIPGLCVACYKENGRGPVLHRPDGTTLLPLPHGEYTVIDTIDYPKVEGYSWHDTGNGYVEGNMPDVKKRTKFHLHRVITGAAPGEVVDHIDHNKRNNTRTNLAVGTQAENMHNIRPQKGREVRGVVLRKDTGRYSAQIQYRRKLHALGCYGTEYEAAKAYNSAAIRLLGNRAVLNDLTAIAPDTVATKVKTVEQNAYAAGYGAATDTHTVAKAEQKINAAYVANPAQGDAKPTL